jgi:hypothetical protein
MKFLLYSTEFSGLRTFLVGLIMGDSLQRLELVMSWNDLGVIPGPVLLQMFP